MIECQRTWPSTLVADRHIFQFGALGGATPDEFLHGSERVEQYLERYTVHRRLWDAPAPDGDFPEAEWGFEPALREDIARFARQHGYRICRVVFQEPEHLSPLVADLYRWSYRQRGIDVNRLLVESFIVLEPYWALRTGSAPLLHRAQTEDTGPLSAAWTAGVEPAGGFLEQAGERYPVEWLAHTPQEQAVG